MYLYNFRFCDSLFWALLPMMVVCGAPLRRWITSWPVEKGIHYICPIMLRRCLPDVSRASADSCRGISQICCDRQVEIELCADVKPKRLSPLSTSCLEKSGMTFFRGWISACFLSTVKQSRVTQLNYCTEYTLGGLPRSRHKHSPLPQGD